MAVIDELIVEIRATADQIDQVFEATKSRIAALEAKAKEANTQMAGMGGAVATGAAQAKASIAGVGAELDKEKQKTKEASAANQELATSYAVVGAAAGAAFAAIIAEISAAIQESNKATNALKGLKSIAEGTKQDFNEAKGAAQGFAADGLLNVSDAATALKNLLARGFDLGEATDIISRLKDSAAFGRQASLSLGEAVRSATEGLKNENSILVDNAGVTKNVAKMWEEYAKSIGKGVQSLSQAEKRQAEYNGIMQETRFMVGDAAKYSQEFAGAQAAVEAATTRVQQAIGRAESAALRPFLNALLPIIDGLSEFIDANPELVAGITASAGALTALIAVIAAYRAAVALASAANIALTASMGWIGAVSLLVGVVAAIAAASTAAETAQAKALELSQENITALDAERKTLQDYLDLQSSGTASTEDLAAAREKVAAQSPTLVAGYDAENKAMLEGNGKIEEQIKLTEEQIRLKRELLLIDAERVLAANASAEAEADAAKKVAKAKMQEAQDYMAELERAKQRGPNAAGNYTGDNGGYLTDELKVLDNLRETAEDVYKDMSKAYDDAQNKINASQADSAVVRKAMYAQEVADYVAKTGEMSAAQQYIVDLTNQQALAEELKQEQFAARLTANMANETLMAEAIKATTVTTEDAAKAVASWADSEKGLEAIQSANKNVQDAKKLTEYVKTVKEGTKGSDDYNKALKALAKGFNTSTEAVEDNLGGFEALASQGYAGAIDAQSKLRASLQAAITELTATKGAADPLVVSLRALLGIFAALGAAPAPAPSGGGGGGTRKKAWEDELEMIGRVMDADKEYAQAYLNHINALLASDRLSKADRARLEKERAYAIKAVDGTLEQDHIAYLERLLEREKLSKDERLKLENELFEAKKAIRSRELDELEDLTGAITDALRARYEQEQAAAEAAINARIKAVQAAADAEIKAINDVANARIDAINDEIKALDAQAQAGDRAKQDAADQKKIGAVTAQLEYETDPGNRAALQAQLKLLQGAYDARKEKEALADKKQALQEEITAVRENAASEVEVINQRTADLVAGLNAQMEATRAYYAAKLDAQALAQEAERVLMEQGQADIIALLEKYAPEYLAKGAALGQALYDGIKPKIDAIMAELARLRAEIALTLRAAAGAAAAAATQTGATGTTGNGGSTTITQTVNFNQPIPTPAQSAAALKKASEAAAKK